MTEQTQFQVGKVYATRGGDRVMHTEVDKDSPYPLAGYFLSGPRQRDFGNWCANGRYREDCEHPLDLLPGALPDPADDDKAELLAVAEGALEPFAALAGAISEGMTVSVLAADGSIINLSFEHFETAATILTAIRAAKEKTPAHDAAAGGGDG